MELCEKTDVSGKVGKDPWLIATRIYLWLMLINQVPKYHNLFATEFQSCISACKKHSVVGKLRIHISRVAALTSAGLEENSASIALFTERERASCWSSSLKRHEKWCSQPTENAGRSVALRTLLEGWRKIIVPWQMEACNKIGNVKIKGENSFRWRNLRVARLLGTYFI